MSILIILAEFFKNIFSKNSSNIAHPQPLYSFFVFILLKLFKKISFLNENKPALKPSCGASLKKYEKTSYYSRCLV